MKRFEYCSVFQYESKKYIAVNEAEQLAEGENYHTVFNQLGKNGWELILSGRTGNRLFYWFKREVK